MARRVAVHLHRVRREDADDEARGHHQPEGHDGSIARRDCTTNTALRPRTPRRLPNTRPTATTQARRPPNSRRAPAVTVPHSDRRHPPRWECPR
jgi:hypothetical protein